MTNISVAIIGENAVRLWGLTSEERVGRLAREGGHDWKGANVDGANLIVNAAFAFDPQWFRHIAANPGMMLTKEGVPVIAHARTAAEAKSAVEAIRSNTSVKGFEEIAIEQGATLTDKMLRKRITPFVARLVPENIRNLERASYFGAYKGVTDLLTKYLWPEWALVLTRIAAKIGMSPNQVTYIGITLCLVAMWLFWIGHYWLGMLSGLIFMVLDTVDGKLARCTITSSKLGDVLDHGVDLVHPPFWWWAWGVGLGSWGLGLSTQTFFAVMATILIGYVVQRLIEGAFILRNGGIHIHVWQKIDSQFRLITARRNPNMVILFVATLLQRPDIGLIALAWWTGLSCLFHLVRLVQAEFARSKSGMLKSWMEDVA